MKSRLAVLLLLAAPALAAPKVAVVIDDFGLNYKSTPPDEEWLKLDAPITWAVMPESPRTKHAAKAALDAGKEVIIHFPFDPFQTYDLAKDAATPADVARAESLLEKALKQIPGAVGLNNHRSYKATQNRPLMKAFMSKLKPKGLYFLDSRVAPKTVAMEEARAAGIKTGINFVFLDTAQVHTEAFCRRGMAQAVARARRDGEAIAIGHHYFRGTLDCLKTELPRYKAEGVEFVNASALMR